MKPTLQQRRINLFRGCAGRESRRHQAFAARKKGVEPLNKVLRIDNPEQLDIVGWKHDAVIGCSLADMAATGRQSEAEPRPSPPRSLEIANADDDVIDTRYAVAHARSHGLIIVKLSGLTSR